MGTAKGKGQRAKYDESIHQRDRRTALHGGICSDDKIFHSWMAIKAFFLRMTTKRKTDKKQEVYPSYIPNMCTSSPSHNKCKSSATKQYREARCLILGMAVKASLIVLSAQHKGGIPIRLHQELGVDTPSTYLLFRCNS